MPSSPGRHRYKRSQRKHLGRHRARSRTGVPLPGLVLASCLIGSAAVFTSSGSANDPMEQQQLANSDLSALMADRTAEEKDTSRSFDRSAASPSPSPSPTPEAVKLPPAPVAGLTQAQMDNAGIIVQVGQSMNLPKR